MSVRRQNVTAQLFAAPVSPAETSESAGVVSAPQFDEPKLALAVREALGFDARLLLRLPLPTALLCSLSHEGGRLVVTTSNAAPAAAGDVQAPTFVGPEFAALVLAAEHDRAVRAHVLQWRTRKLAEPTWRLTSREAIGAVIEPLPPRGWSVGQVLRRLGMQLEEVLA
jgi:hypothetical protein